MVIADHAIIASDRQDPRLGIVCDLVADLDKHNIQYCHWKSNEHLLPAVKGDTDLDILFDQRQKQKVDKILTGTGYVKFKPRWYLKYPQIEDYLSIDAVTGKLVHVHAHFRLVLGEKRIKSYRLPWEHQILRNRIWDSDCGIFRSDSCHELLLLLVRLVLKLPVGSVIPNRAFKSIKEAADANQEFHWLKDRVTKSQLQKLGKSLLGDRSEDALAGLYMKGLDRKRLQKLLIAAKPTIDQCCRYGKFTRLCVRVARNSTYIAARVNQKLGLFDFPVRRTAIHNGLIITLMGPDGSGKSTQIKIIKKILSAKIDVLSIYMGSGDGKASLVRLPLILCKKIIKKICQGDKPTKKNTPSENTFRGNEGSGQHNGRHHGKFSLTRSIWNILWAVSLSLEKTIKLKRAARARARGMIVICDRYPQTTIQGFNDGPLLQEYAKSSFKFLRWLARFEIKCFSNIEKTPPDLAVKLMGDPDVLHLRRPEMNREKIVEKQEGIRSIRFPYKTRVQVIDANLPIEGVTIQIMSTLNYFFFTHHNVSNNNVRN
jgi:thymidylate kinase